MAGLVFLSGCSMTRKGVPESLSTLSQNLSNSSIKNRPIAVLPVENLSGTAAPLKEIRKSLIKGLVERGFNVLEEKLLESFMAKHRMRYIGGVDGGTAKALQRGDGGRIDPHHLVGALRRHDSTQDCHDLPADFTE